MSDRDIWERILRAAPELAALFPREPSYRYFEHRGHMYCWTTEKMSDGKYHAFDYVPVGKGARTNPRQWKLRNEVKCRTRQLAKRKAHDRYRKARGLDKSLRCAVCDSNAYTWQRDGRWLCAKHYHHG